MTSRQPAGPGTDPPPAFPPWRRRLDPLLAAEDTNHLYRAFRLRRTVHLRRTWTSWLTRLATGQWRLLDFSPFMLLVLIAVATAVWGLLAGAVMFGVGVFFLAIQMSPTGPFARSAMPRRAGALVLPAGKLPPSIEEVWLTGATSDDFIEAIYLEMRESQFAVSFLMCSLFGLAGFALVTLIARETHTLPIVFPIVFLGVIVESVFFFDAVLSSVIVTNILPQFLNRWHMVCASGHFWWWVLRSLGYGCLFVIFCALALFAGGLFCVGAGLLLRLLFKVTRMSIDASFLEGHVDGWMVASVVALLLMGILEHLRRRAGKQTLRLLRHQQQRARFLFDAYLGLTVFQDPDAVWVSERVNGKPLFPAPRPEGRLMRFFYPREAAAPRFPEAKPPS